MLLPLGDDVDGLEHLGDDLRRQRHVHRHKHAEAERESERHRQDVGAEQPALQAGQTQRPGQPSSAAEEDLGLLPADRDHRNDRRPRRHRRIDVAGAPAEVDDVLVERGPVDVEIPAGEQQHCGVGLQGGRGVVRVGGDHSQVRQELGGRAVEERVVRQHVERAVVAEVFVEVDGEHREVRGGEPAGVVAHQQAPPGRDAVEAADLRAVVDLHHRPQQVDHVPGQHGVEPADLVVGCRFLRRRRAGIGLRRVRRRGRRSCRGSCPPRPCA